MGIQWASGSKLIENNIITQNLYGGIYIDPNDSPNPIIKKNIIYNNII